MSLAPSRNPLAVGLLLVWLLLAACGGEKRTLAIAIAYAGPATLNLRKDIPLQSPVVATVKHGERLAIIQHRRRFLKVRAPNGVEGWTDERLLLSTEEITTLRAFEKDVKALPSQGTATTYEALNVHTEPDRLSPSFIQLKENEKFEVLAHRVAPRVAAARKPLIPPPERKAPAAKKPRSSGRLAPPPLPPPPGTPVNWLQLSQTPAEILAARAEAKQEEKPVPQDDWSLIRTARGESGWVLTRRLFLAIPDEVAQYAEGRRITSYFSLGDVPDGDVVKHNWLWTTISESNEPYDFDSFRVFIWSLRRHRYETAYIERKVQGYFPVLLAPVQYGAPVKLKGSATASNTYPGFSLCLQTSDGARVRRSYAFLVNIVRKAGESPCEVPSLENPKVPVETFVASAEATQQTQGRKESMLDRFKLRLQALRKRWLGK